MHARVVLLCVPLCIVLHCVALCCFVLLCVALCCFVLLCAVVLMTCRPQSRLRCGLLKL